MNTSQLPMFKDSILNAITGFLAGIGIEVVPGEISEHTFLPGLKIAAGKIHVDENKLLSPGDVLHEAGHLAVVPVQDRLNLAETPLINDPGNEMAAIAWSWAALKHLDLAPEIVFHPGGYKGDSDNIIENFSNNRYFGVPLLQYKGLCLEQKLAAEKGIKPFPYMIKWTVN